MHTLYYYAHFVAALACESTGVQRYVITSGVLNSITLAILDSSFEWYISGSSVQKQGLYNSNNIIQYSIYAMVSQAELSRLSVRDVITSVVIGYAGII